MDNIKDLKIYEFGDSECWSPYVVLAKDMITAIQLFHKAIGYYAERVHQKEFIGTIIIESIYEPENVVPF